MFEPEELENLCGLLLVMVLACTIGAGLFTLFALGLVLLGLGHCWPVALVATTVAMTKWVIDTTDELLNNE